MTRAAIDFAFLHGGGQGGWVWDETIAALRQQTNGEVRTFALDVPGCGVKRGRDTAELTVDDVTVELLSDLTNAGMEDIILVGHSQAGTIMPRLTQMRPDLFRRLIYVSCSSPLPGQTILQMMGTCLHGESEDEVGWPTESKARDVRERYPRMFCNDMTEAETAAFLAKLDRDAWPMKSYAETNWRYDHLDHTPATYVVCSRDGILPVAWQEKFADRFKARRVVRLDAGHQAMSTRPHALAELLLREAVAE